MSKTIEEVVREKYGAVAASTLSSEHKGVRSVAQAFGYSAEELAEYSGRSEHGTLVRQPDGHGKSSTW